MPDNLEVLPVTGPNGSAHVIRGVAVALRNIAANSFDENAINAQVGVLESLIPPHDDPVWITAMAPDAVMPEQKGEDWQGDIVPEHTERHLPAYIRAKARTAAKHNLHDTARTLNALAEEVEQGLHEQAIDIQEALTVFYKDVHGRNVKANWWNDLATGLPKKRSVGELFILFVTEIAEAYEAYMENAADDKLPDYPGLGVELGDLQIRLADFCGALAEGNIVAFSGTDNPGGNMFYEIMAIAKRYEAIRKTDAAKGADETGDFLPPMDVAEMVMAKLDFNATRPDHKVENRLKADGKRT